MERQNQDRFDDNATDIRYLIHDRNAAQNALLRNPTSCTLCERFSSKRATVQRKLRWMKNNWWAEKAAQIQSYLPTLPIIPKLDDPPSFDEVEKAILSLKDNKAAGPDNIPAEVIKYGECALHRRLFNFILDCWSAKCLPQQWKNANIILVHKQKGDRAECGNSHGISLLSVAGKVMAKIMITRLLEHVVNLVLPEPQCGFQHGRSTII